jgi:argininosuccinate synthase
LLEDPWDEPPADAFAWTVDPAKAPNEPAYVTIDFEHGRPTGLDGKPMDGVPLIERLNKLGGEHGVGRIDHVENRLVGIKSRELYEAPAGVILHEAHRELETLCLTKQAARFKTLVAQEYADLIYNGLWFSGFHQDLAAFVASNQRFVSGQVRVKLFKGKATVVGRKSEHSLYSKKLATYESGDNFDHDAAKGFIRLWGLGQQTQAAQQLLKGGKGFELPGLLGPRSQEGGRTDGE